MFEQLADSKKLLEKLRKCCMAITKFNLNSPCCLQFIRHAGEYEVILSHDPINGNTYDFYKLFSMITYDDFTISQEDVKLFDFEDERTSIPILVSSTDLTKVDKYIGSKQIYYIYPKFVIQAIRENVIKYFEVSSTWDKFDINIQIDSSIPKYRSSTFILGTDKLNYILNISALPLGRRNNVTSTMLDMGNDKVVAYLKFTGKEWEELLEKHKFHNFIELEASNKHKIILYHNDFFPKKVDQIYVEKLYESPNAIATIRCNVIDNNKVTYQFFRYRYYEVM